MQGTGSAAEFLQGFTLPARLFAGEPSTLVFITCWVSVVAVPTLGSGIVCPPGVLPAFAVTRLHREGRAPQDVLRQGADTALTGVGSGAEAAGAGSQVPGLPHCQSSLKMFPKELVVGMLRTSLTLSLFRKLQNVLL